MCNIWFLHDRLVYNIIFVFFIINGPTFYSEIQDGRRCNFIYEKIFNPLIKIMFDLSLLSDFGRMLFLLCLLNNLTNISYMNQRWPPFFIFIKYNIISKTRTKYCHIKRKPRSTTHGLSQLMLSGQTDRQTYFMDVAGLITDFFVIE